MRAGTKGAALWIKTEAPHQIVRDMVEEGMIQKPKAADLDRWAEQEFKARTSGGWSDLTCPRCALRFARNGTCECSDTPRGEMERAVMVLQLGGLLP